MELLEFLGSKAVANENAPKVLSAGTCKISKVSDLKVSKYGEGYSLSVNGGDSIFIKAKHVDGVPHTSDNVDYEILQGTNKPFMKLTFANRFDAVANAAGVRGFAISTH